MVETRSAGTYDPERVETRGCSYRVPGHDWFASRIQRDQGFLAPGSGNDEYALAYFVAEDLPIYAALARRFTIFDHWHASLLGPTFPNRQYFLSATSEGNKTDPKLHTVALGKPIYHAPTIIERLAQAGVPVGYYYTNIPLLALWGVDRTATHIRSLDRFFEDAANGTLPHVAFVEPQFGGTDALRTDDHPRGDVGMGQRWIREVLRAFTASPHWERGALIVTYDEHGGFFDHVRPPHFPDARSSRVDVDDFGQGGFRVPALVVSPAARRGAVDHRRYDHTSISRFLEWRFLGAPPEGPRGSSRWALTERDRGALNMGRSLTANVSDPELGFNLDMALRPVAPACTVAQLASHRADRDPDPFEHPAFHRRSAKLFPPATHRPWLTDAGI